MSAPPFPRTTCACDACVDCCRRPAHLLPDELRPLAEHLRTIGRITNLEDVLDHLRPGKGALVLTEDRVVRRIATIVPATDPDGWCTFFDRVTRQCTVHAVAPFGCRFFDMHMDHGEGNARSLWGLRKIARNLSYAVLVAVLLRRGAR